MNGPIDEEVFFTVREQMLGSLRMISDAVCRATEAFPPDGVYVGNLNYCVKQMERASTEIGVFVGKANWLMAHSEVDVDAGEG